MAHQNGEKGSYNDKELRDMIVNFMLAGRDTTAATMSWFVYRMCCLPEVADKIYEEGVRVIGKHESFESAAECLRHDTLAKMHYLHAAIEESIRLHPPVSRVRMMTTIFQWIICQPKQLLNNLTLEICHRKVGVSLQVKRFFIILVSYGYRHLTTTTLNIVFNVIWYIMSLWQLFK